MSAHESAAARTEVLSVCVPGVLESRADEVLPLASVGKLLLLAEIARAVAEDELDPDQQVDVLDEDRCGGSGLLVDLSPSRWTLRDLVLLTASVSDNTATNALIRLVGVERVNARAAQLGLRRTRLLDRIREPRLSSHPTTFARGTARELASLAARVAGDEPWARMMLGWLASNTDRGMVAAAIPHDPEAREMDAITGPEIAGAPLLLRVANKTGTDTGIRADVGVVRIGGGDGVGKHDLCYAVIGHCSPGSEYELIRSMRAVGRLIARAAGTTPPE